MRCSLFGKLALKRDFIALSVPREFLGLWEPWMQSCVSASRDRLGDAWLQAYLTAPIWRFWLGAEICGATVAGALMSSLDGVGRHYPLTVFAYTTAENAIAPPDVDAHEKWFAAAEEFLLSTLDPEANFDVIASALDLLDVPGSDIADSPAQNLSALKDGVMAGTLGDQSFSDLFTLLRAANHSSIYAAASFWWTMGGDECQPFGFCCRRMPEPSLFANMLTGRLDSADK